MITSEILLVALNTGQGVLPAGTRIDVFHEIFLVFLVLGTLVGLVVISYMLYNAYKYRAGHGRPADEGFDPPKLGELPQGGGGGRKLFVSFALSAVIVVSLIVWTYGTLLYVEDAPAQEPDALEIQVEAYQFNFAFTYPNGHTVDGELRVPQGKMVKLVVTSRDVFHTFGAPGLRVKADAIPGQTISTWFVAEETRTYRAACYELCGVGHSWMTSEVIVMEPDAFEQWYANTTAS